MRICAGSFSSNCRTISEPIDPVPPVTNIFLSLYSLVMRLCTSIVPRSESLICLLQACLKIEGWSAKSLYILFVIRNDLLTLFYVASFDAPDACTRNALDEVEDFFKIGADTARNIDDLMLTRRPKRKRRERLSHVVDVYVIAHRRKRARLDRLITK